MTIYRVTLNYLSPASEEPGTTTFILCAKTAKIAETSARAKLEEEGKQDIELAYAINPIATLTELKRNLKVRPEKSILVERNDY